MLCFQGLGHSLFPRESKWIFCCIVRKCKCCFDCMSAVYAIECISSFLSYRCSIHFYVCNLISGFWCNRKCYTFIFCNSYFAFCKAICCDGSAFTCCSCDVKRSQRNIPRADDEVVNSRTLIGIRGCNRNHSISRCYYFNIKFYSSENNVSVLFGRVNYNCFFCDLSGFFCYLNTIFGIFRRTTAISHDHMVGAGFVCVICIFQDILECHICDKFSIACIVVIRNLHRPIRIRI